MKKKEYLTPQEVPEALKSILVICLAHRFAKAYRLQSRKISALEFIETEDTDYFYSDKEGLSFIPRGAGGSGVAGQATVPGIQKDNKQHYLSVFMNYFVTELEDLVRQGKFERVVIFSPDDMRNAVRDKMEKHLLAKTEFLSGNFTKHHPVELVKLLFQESPHLFELTK